jgi:hypothetical protein
MGNETKVIAIGERFNRLVFKGEATPKFQKNGNRKRYGYFHCDCGREKSILIYAVTSSHVLSCGCYGKEIRGNMAAKRNFRHGLSKHSIYRRWLRIKDRCLNKKNSRYKDYGGRGISICKSWLKFKNFYNWCIANGYVEGLEIDRKNNNSGYKPSNCRFVTTKTNCNNTRRNIIIDFNGESLTLMQACERVGLRDKYRTIWQNIKSGKNFSESIKSYQNV